MIKNRPMNQIDLGGVIISIIMIVIGSLALWDTTNMTDSDSFVFPRAVVIVMISLSIIYIIRQIISPSFGRNDEAGITGGSNLRRTGLVLAMVGSSMLMPWLGFMVSGILAFGSIMMLAMYDEWTLKLRILYPLLGTVIVIGFYLLFASLLSVPLPVGSLFE